MRKEVGMIFRKYLSASILVFLLFPSVLFAQSIRQGDFYLLRIDGYIKILGLQKSKLEVYFDGEKIPLFDYQGKTYLAFYTDFQKPPGRYKMKVLIEGKEVFSRNIDVVHGNFEEIFQGKPYKPAELSPLEIVRIRKEKRKFLDVISKRSTEKIWDTPFSYPLDFIFITSKFGVRRVYTNYVTYHRGVDFKADSGTAVKAISDGLVIWGEDSPLYFEGKTVVLDHGNGIISLYMHLSEVNVERGEFVKGGDVIGKVGSTGFSNAPHLHLSIKVWNAYIDPIKFIEEFRRIKD